MLSYKNKIKKNVINVNIFKKIWPVYYNCKEDLKNEFYQLTRLLSEKK